MRVLDRPLVTERSTRGAGAEGAAPADLRLRRLAVSYGQLVALSPLDLTVPAGSSIAVLGPNGAGKSSLLGAISGAVRPIRGSVQLGADRLERLPAHVVRRHGVCHVPEGRGVLPGLTVSENLRLSLPDEDDRERAFAVFPRLGERRAQQAGTLSGGEQQMLAVAAALARDHRLLLVDEVSLGLAPVIVDELYEVLHRVRDTGVSIVLVEQFAERALALADRAIVLVKGRIAYSGSSGALREEADLLHRLYLGAEA